MSEVLSHRLSRRERQIMDAVYRKGQATAAEVQGLLPEDPGYDSVRVTLRILEKKGFVTHHREGNRHVYSPTIPHEEASESALRHLMRTFFGDKPNRAILALLDIGRDRLSEEQLDELARSIDTARHEDEGGGDEME